MAGIARRLLNFYCRKCRNLIANLPFMRATFTCLLTGMLMSVAAFSQNDSTQSQTTLSPFNNKKFNNPFHNLPNDEIKPASFISLLKGPEMRVSSYSRYSGERYMPYSFYSENLPVWKELILTATKIAISAYEDNRSLMHFYPRQ